MPSLSIVFQRNPRNVKQKRDRKSCATRSVTMQSHLDQELGNYRLTRLLGSGGFADVYLGEHIHLGTQAAIKVHHMHMDGADLERFEQEARTIAHLSHSHILRVLDYGVQYDVPFLVMDYAPHGTLRDLHPAGTIVP